MINIQFDHENRFGGRIPMNTAANEVTVPTDAYVRLVWGLWFGPNDYDRRTPGLGIDGGSDSLPGHSLPPTTDREHTMSSTVTIVIPDHTEDDGLDRIYVHGAQIADPENNVNVTWDGSEDPSVPVYLLTVEPSEDEAPYREALDAIGIEVTGQNDEGDWTGTQTRAL